MCLYGTLRNFIEIFMDLFGTIWNYLELFGTLWNFMDLYGSIWTFTDLYGSLWTFFDNPFWTVNSISLLKHVGPWVRGSFGMCVSGRQIFGD